MSEKITITRRIQFCAGHRVYGHESKCAHIHGHNYIAFIVAESENLDPLGRVIDFGVIKEIVGGWIDKYWDHGFIANKNDPMISAIAKFCKDGMVYAIDGNPTAENIAKDLLQNGNRLLRQLVSEEYKSLKIISVTIHETENCYATYSESE